MGCNRPDHGRTGTIEQHGCHDWSAVRSTARYGVWQFRVIVDDDAAGIGWFVDGTPYDHAEFVSGIRRKEKGETSPNGMYDILSVVAHEFGHRLGLSDVDPDQRINDVMGSILQPGQRRLPQSVHFSLSEADEASMADRMPQQVVFQTATLSGLAVRSNALEIHRILVTDLRLIDPTLAYSNELKTHNPTQSKDVHMERESVSAVEQIAVIIELPGRLLAPQLISRSFVDGESRNSL